jgi:hypothetical protein
LSKFLTINKEKTTKSKNKKKRFTWIIPIRFTIVLMLLMGLALVTPLVSAVLVGDFYQPPSATQFTELTDTPGNYTNPDADTFFVQVYNNALRFYDLISWVNENFLNLSGGVLTGDLYARNIFPNETLTYELGSGALRWKKLWVQDINAENIDTFTIVANTINVSGNITALNLNGTNTGDQVASDFNHNDLSNTQGGSTDENYHLNQSQHTDLTDGGNTDLHIHDGRYYTETETDNLLDDKADSSDLGNYWKRDGSSTATGNWDLGSKEITSESFILDNDEYGMFVNLPNKKNIGFAALGVIPNTIRGRTIRAVEYYDTGTSTWTTWVGHDVENMLDGDYRSYATVPQAYTTAGWRFSVSAMQWKKTFAIGINKQWASGTFSLPYTLVWETSSDEVTWTTRKTWTVPNGISGYQDILFGIPENGDQYWRFTMTHNYNPYGDVRLMEFAIFGAEPGVSYFPLQWKGLNDATFINNLDVEGELTVISDSSGANPVIYSINDENVETRIFTVRSGSARSGDTWIQNSANNDIILKTTGNVGIGTETPSKTLDVAGDISLEAGSGNYYSNDGSQGWTGTFTNGDGDTVTVKNGIITDIS